jgi:heterodisulfide reductase subunit A
MDNSVLVIGGGIAGIQAATDLANMGFSVYLVERTPSIGGRMAQLDKTFPTNDCAMCILAPKMIECYRHQRVTILSYSEVAQVKGEIGNFKVKVLRKPRYIDEIRCTGCGECIEKCPWRVNSEFDMGRGTRKAIYIPFPQAMPNIPVIDKEHCAYFLKGTCRACERFCEAKAIDFEQVTRSEEIEVGAIIMAIGLDLYDITSLKEYGYGRIANVITAMDYERLTSASGPTGGEPKRPSDGKTPSNIAFIQCVGSRDSKHNPYCSSVCCMHATKEAILAAEHYPGTKSTIFYTDLRAVGKRFQEYIARAKEQYNVAYIRSRPGKVEIAGNGNPIIWYEDITGETKPFETELVILCQALIPSHGTAELARLLGISLDKYGFVETPDLFHPLDATRPGIFVCGYVHSPRDIPDSIAQASGVAARVTEVMTGGA